MTSEPPSGPQQKIRNAGRGTEKPRVDSGQPGNDAKALAPFAANLIAFAVLLSGLCGVASGVDNAVPAEGMISIPSALFEMGSDGGGPDERPTHRVSVPSFLLDRTEVTCARFRDFLLANPEWRKDRVPVAMADANYLRDWDGLDFPRGKADHPVVWVSWHAAHAYAKWRGARLPTEAEWEAAARGGEGRVFPWGNDPPGTGPPRANYGHRERDDGFGQTSPVGSFPAGATPEGVQDMAGNVWEWVADWHDPDYYSDSPRWNPLGPASGTYRVARGGSWSVPIPWVRSFVRLRAFPSKTSDQVGFRCARSLNP